MKKILLGIIALMFCVSSYAQTVIQMEKYGGVYRIPCKVNGAKMKLIFDTGADKVCISLTMAEYLLDNDYISTSDIKGTGSSTVADGSVVNHVKINIKDIEIQGIHLKNVEAVVIDGQNAPLLFGQSAIKRLGKYSISGNKLIIGTSSESSSQLKEAIPLTDDEIDKLFEEAANAYSNRAYRVALEIYKQLYEYELLSPIGIMSYADCYYYTEQYEDALELYQAIKNEVESKYPEDKVELYYQIGRCLLNIGDNNSALTYFEKSKYYSEPYSYYHVHSVKMMMWCYKFKNDYYFCLK